MVFGINIFEVIGFVFALAGVWLAAKQNIWTWPVGLVGIIAYLIFFYQIKLYADMGLQAFYIAASIYGWYEWLHGGKNKAELPVSRLRNSQRILAVFTGAVFSMGLAFYFRTYTDAHYPTFDSGLAGFSLVAQFLLTRKKIENWVVWFLVDIGYVGLYWLKGAYLTTALYSLFLLLAVRGYILWRKELLARTA